MEVSILGREGQGAGPEDRSCPLEVGGKAQVGKAPGWRPLGIPGDRAEA